MSDDSGLDPNTFPIFGLFSFILFMTPVLKWIYVNVMREYAPQQQKPALAATNLNNQTHRRVE
jgi:hypothetical protein